MKNLTLLLFTILLTLLMLAGCEQNNSVDNPN